MHQNKRDNPFFKVKGLGNKFKSIGIIYSFPKLSSEEIKQQPHAVLCP